MKRQRRTVERAVLMHGTSARRLEAARLLAKIAREAGAHGATYGWRDDLATRLAPVHTVAGGPRMRWEVTLPQGFAARLERLGEAGWRLVIRGAGARMPEHLRPLLAQAERLLEAAQLDDCTTIPDAATRGPEGRFVALLDALRFVSFALPRPRDVRHVRDELRRATPHLPRGTWRPAHDVADAVDDLDRLPGELAALGRALEQEGRLAAAAGVHVILYELALLRCDADSGMKAAHGAGRAFRKLTDWREALRWYQLGLRLADHEGDFLQTARLLDGLGNTHRERGSFPNARRCYRDAWRFAVVARDPVEIGNVALGMMTMEREAGHLDDAARFAWRALQTQSDAGQRMNLLLNLGTLLRDGGALGLAEDVYRVVRLVAQDAEVRLMAQDALAYCAALCGDRAEYARRRSAVRAAARSASAYVRAQIGYFRGTAMRALGDERAPRVLRATERFARTHGLREWQVRAGALADRRAPVAVPTTVTVRAPEEVRAGIGRLLAAARGSSSDA